MYLTSRFQAALPQNQFANNFNYSVTNTIVPYPTDLTGWGVIMTVGQSNMAQYTNEIPPAPANASKIRQFMYGDGTLRQFQHPVFGPPGTMFISGQAHSNQVIDGMPTVSGIQQGCLVQGFGALPNTTVAQIVFPDTVFVTPNITYTGPGNWDFSPLIGNWFGYLGDRLINDGTFPNGVIFINTAIGGTLSSQWSPNPGGNYHSILSTAVKRARSVGLPISAIIVGQGETENFEGISGDIWCENWRNTIKTIRGYGVIAPWFFALQTLNAGVFSTSVQAGQIKIWGDTGVYPGPNLEARSYDYRWDTPATHFGRNNVSGFNGGQVVAGDWADVLANHKATVGF